MAKDGVEKQSMKLTLEVGWREFLEIVVKNHVPLLLPVIEELYLRKIIPYPPPEIVWLISRDDSGASVPTKVQNVFQETQPTNALGTHMSASAYTGTESRPIGA